MIARRWYGRPLVALLLLAVEYLAISFGFDAQSLLGHAGAWEGLGWIGLLGTALVTFATALWMLAGNELRAAFSRAASGPSHTGSLLRRLGFHLVCFVAFFAATAQIFREDGPPQSLPGLWISSWVLLGVATVTSLVPVAFGGLGIRSLLRELRTPIALSALLGLAAWGAGVTAIGLWEPLGGITLDAVVLLLSAFVSPVYFDPAEAAVGTAEFSVWIAPVCSGYEGIGLTLAFLTGYLVIFRERVRLPQGLLLIPLAVVAVWFLNVVRIVLLILIGHAGYPDVATGGFHSKAGWLLFCIVALGAVWATQHIPWLNRDEGNARGRVVNPSGPFLLPLLAVVATALVTGLFIDDFDYWYPLRVVVALVVLAWYRTAYAAQLAGNLRGRRLWSWPAVGIGVAVYVVWVGLSLLEGPLGEPPPEALSELATPLALVWIMGRLVGAVLIAPVVEELAFRGFLLRRLIAPDFVSVPYDRWSWPAVLLSSLAFSALHQQWLGGFVAGALYAFAQQRRGALTDAMVAHGVTNALIAAEVLLAGHWALW